MKQDIVTEQRVFDELKKAIVQTLGIDEQLIKPESSLVKDLGVESLDFLDINYRLEQTFRFKMARHFILEHIEEMFGEGSAIDEDAQLTEKAIEVLKVRYWSNPGDLKPGMDMDELPTLITMDSMVQGVMEILNTLPEKCPHCGQSSWTSDDGARIRCDACSKDATFTNGDDLIKEWLQKIQEENHIF